MTLEIFTIFLSVIIYDTLSPGTDIFLCKYIYKKKKNYTLIQILFFYFGLFPVYQTLSYFEFIFIFTMRIIFDKCKLVPSIYSLFYPCK